MTRSPEQTTDAGDGVPIERSTGELFFEVADELRALFRRAADELGLTPMETTALRHAARHRQLAAIIEEIGLTPTRVSSLLGALERKGLVTRAKARGDHRQRIVTLTPAGEAAVATFDARLERESPLLRKLTPAQHTALRELLLTLRS